MTDLARTRFDVIELLRRFDEPQVRDHWLEHQAMLWDWEPSVVLTLLASPALVPAGRVALAPTSSTSTDVVAVLDSTLLRGSRVTVVPETRTVHPWMSWLQSVEALRDLYADLGIQAPTLPPFGTSPEDWGKAATWIMVGHVLEEITGDHVAAGIGRVIVWHSLGLQVERVPAPAGPDESWQQILEVLTLAASAAATVLTVLGTGGGGRELRASTWY